MSVRSRPAAAFTAVALSLSLVGCAVLVRRSWPEPNAGGVVAELDAPVNIHLDGLGVAHVFAASSDDAAAAVGFLHARYRGFQMEMIRLASQGRLTEALGADLLDVDRRLRILTYQLDEATANLPAADRARLEAYCRGINEGIRATPTPLELKLLKHERAPWTPRDVMAVGRLQSWDLSADAAREALRERALAHAPPETHAWLSLPSPHLGQTIVDPAAVRQGRPEVPAIPAPRQGTALRDPLTAQTAAKQVMETTAPSAAVLPEGAEALRQEIAASMEAWLERPRERGSNSWAIAPGRTREGHAILAGDPHLDLGFPSTFYEVHVHTPDLDYSGATFPGLPMVVIGRAAHVAWTLTTSYADAQDLFSLEVKPDDPMSYRLDDAWVGFAAWPQTFRWGEGEDERVEETYRVSHFGPVYNPGREAKILAGKTYALSWSGFGTEPLPLTSMFDALYRAETPGEVVAAIRLLPTPSQNWTFATDSGHIGYVLGGRLPARRASHLPQDGTRRTNAWGGWMAEEDRPVVLDPTEGFIVTANQAVMPDLGRFNHYASGPYRARRIAQALEDRTDWDPSLSRALQVDAYNLEAGRVVPILLAGYTAEAFTSQPDAVQAQLGEMVAAVRGWNLEMATSSAAPLIYEAWRGELHQRLFSFWINDEALRNELLVERETEAPTWAALFEEGQSRWWDDPRTPAVESQADAVRAALLDARSALSARFGDDPAGWRWGEAHTLTLDHPFASKAALKPLFGVDPVEIPGGRHCVYAMDHLGVVGSYETTSGPALRQVVAPGHVAGFTMPGGNAGQPRHPYALNQLDDWLVGIQHRAGGTEAEVSAIAVETLVLQPAD